MTDMPAEKSARQARSSLFAGAIRSYKNALFHRDVNIDEADKATELAKAAEQNERCETWICAHGGGAVKRWWEGTSIPKENAPNPVALRVRTLRHWASRACHAVVDYGRKNDRWPNMNWPGLVSKARD